MYQNHLFEQSFYSNYKHWVRLYNKETKRSEVQSLPNQHEYFVEHENGSYESLYNPDLRYVKKVGTSRDVKKGQAQVSPKDIVIREYFKGKYNHKPTIMYLDIETRVGQNSTGFPTPKYANEAVSLIQFNEGDTVHLIGLKEFHYFDEYMKLPDHLNKEVKYHQVKNEHEIFQLFFNFIHQIKPAIMLAWNGCGFDFGYLYNRAKKIGLDVNKFSPWYFELLEAYPKGFDEDIVKLTESQFDFKDVYKLSIFGCQCIDMKDLYQKFVLKPRPNYQLNTIAEIELKANKVDHSEFNTFDNFYLGKYQIPANPTEAQKAKLCYKLATSGASQQEIENAGHSLFLYYGILDIVLLIELDKKCSLTKLLIMISEKLESQYSDALRTTTPWGNYIRNRLYEQNKIVIPEHNNVDENKHVLGGFVREPKRGKQEWVISADYNSLYPSMIRAYNISPETFIHPRNLDKEYQKTGNEDYLKLKEFIYKHYGVDTEREQDESMVFELIKHPELVEEQKRLLKSTNLSLAPNGMTFRHRDALAPTVMGDIYNERKATKKKMLQAEQLAVIIQQVIDEK